MVRAQDVELAVTLLGLLCGYATYLTWQDRRRHPISTEDARAAALCDLVADPWSGVDRVRVLHTRQSVIDAVTREAKRRGLVSAGAFSAALGVGRVIVARRGDALLKAR